MLTTILIPENWYPLVILALGPILGGSLIAIGLIVGHRQKKNKTAPQAASPRNDGRRRPPQTGG